MEDPSCGGEPAGELPARCPDILNEVRAELLQVRNGLLQAVQSDEVLLPGALRDQTVVLHEQLELEQLCEQQVGAQVRADPPPRPHRLSGSMKADGMGTTTTFDHDDINDDEANCSLPARPSPLCVA